MHSFHYRDGRLHCEDVDLAGAVQEFGTPLYIYSAGTILDHYRRLDAALAPLDHLICYAVKANSNRAILKLLADAGAGFDIVSGGELFRVLEAGGDQRSAPSPASANRVKKSSTRSTSVFTVSMSRAKRSWNRSIESPAQKNVRAPIALAGQSRCRSAHPRIHLDRVGTRTNSESRWSDSKRFTNAAAKMRNIDIVGVQMHIGSQITEAEPFATAIKKVAPLARHLKSKYGIKFFSIGGGMGIIYRRALESGSGKWWHEHGGEPSAFSVRDYADAIVPPLRDLGVRILVEPGRFLVGNAGVLLTRVRYIKETGQKKFAIVDAGMNDLIRPALYHSYHEIVPCRGVPPRQDAHREDRHCWPGV